MIKDLHLILCFMSLVIGVLLGFIHYHNTQSREAYLECLRITEKLLEADPGRFSTHYCRQ